MCPRDVTPEVVKSLIHRDTPGITSALLMGSLNITPMAMASRLTSGIRHQTLIICFPGSPKACKECFEIVNPALIHCLRQLEGDLLKVEADHCCFHEKSQPAGSSPVFDPRKGVAFRPRNSTSEMIEVKDAQERVRKQITRTEMVEEISIKDVGRLLGKVLSCDVISQVDIPPFPASMKDGYAVLGSDGMSPRQVLSTPSYAGVEPQSMTVSPGCCVRISTGAPVPEGADSVVQVEDTELLEAGSDGEEKMIRITRTPDAGQDIRPVGCDVQKGQCVLHSGCILNPPQLGILASVGLQVIKVVKAPLIGLLSTGDEIIEAGREISNGKIWDSNKTLLMALLVKYNFEYIDFGISKDNYSHTCEKLQEALDSKVDVMITTGGVSMGEKDIIKSVFRQEFGAMLHFGRVNMKPGKPTAFMTCDWKGSRKLIFGLPGNPVSTHVTFHLFVLPTIQSLKGMEFDSGQRFDAKLITSYPLRLDSRPEYARGLLIGQEVHLATGSQRSSRLLSLNGADVLVMLPPSSSDKKVIGNGERVSYIPIG